MDQLPCQGLGPVLPVDAAVEQVPEGAVVKSLWQSQQQVLGQLCGHGQFSQDLVIQNLPSGETLSLQAALPACRGACQGKEGFSAFAFSTPNLSWQAPPKQLINTPQTS